MKQRRFISVLAAGALCLSLLPTAAFAAESMDNFKAEREYPAGQFTDVVAGSWYAGSVEKAYELGLVEGTRVECLGLSPAGDPRAFLIRGAMLAIRSGDCRDIIVNKV